MDIWVTNTNELWRLTFLAYGEKLLSVQKEYQCPKKIHDQTR